MIDLAPPGKSTRKAKGDGHLRRAELLQAAERLFLTDGYERTTVRRIAEEVGVSSTTLYMHFADKSEMLLEIGVNAARALSEDVEIIAASGRRPEERVRELLRALIRFGRDNRYAYQLLFCVADPAVVERRRGPSRALISQCYGHLSSALAELKEQGRLRATCPDLTAQAMWSACHGVVAFSLAFPDNAQASPAELEPLTVDALLRGLAEQPN